MLTLLTLLLAVAVPSLGRHVPLIIGGVEAPVGQWPWQGSLEVKNRGHNCGCVLISTSWAVTAAHCVPNSASYYTVTFGLHDRFDWSYGWPTRYNIDRIVKHKDFINGGVFPNDIAVIHFEKYVQLNNYVDTVQMAPENTIYDGNCWITGWGVTTTGGGSMADRLRQANVAIVDTATCRKYWNVDSKHVCIGIKDQRGSCNGDSGGPLVCYVDNDHYELAGVTSFGVIGCYTSHPSVYTAISYHRGWIKYHTGL